MNPFCGAFFMICSHSSMIHKKPWKASSSEIFHGFYDGVGDIAFWNCFTVSHKIIK